MKEKKKTQDIWVAPKRCPLMKSCEEDVPWDTFEAICETQNWVFCKKAEKAAKKYKRKPYEWKLIHELGGLPHGV